jgi:hypothetical protein
MADLSPSAQAVMDAFERNCTWEVVNDQAKAVAAALRVAADQSILADTAVDQTEEVVLVSDLLAIADELESL